MIGYGNSSILAQGESLNIFPGEQLYQAGLFQENEIFGGDYLKELEEAFYFFPQSAQEENPQPALE